MKRKCKYSNDCLFAKYMKMQTDNDINPSIARWIDTNLCDKNFQKCARYMIAEAMGETKVPDWLYPTRLDKVENILKINAELAAFYLSKSRPGAPDRAA